MRIGRETASRPTGEGTMARDELTRLHADAERCHKRTRADDSLEPGSGGSSATPSSCSRATPVDKSLNPKLSEVTMSQSYGQQYFESIADKRIRDTLNRLGFLNGNTIVIVGDGSKISILR